MFLSPTQCQDHPNSDIFNKTEVQDFFSSSKKIVKEKKAESINNIIKKVEQEIKNKEINADESAPSNIPLLPHSFSSQSCSNSFYQQQGLNSIDEDSTLASPANFNSGYLTPQQQSTRPQNSKIFLNSPGQRRFTCPIGQFISAQKTIQSHAYKRNDNNESAALDKNVPIKTSGFTSSDSSQSTRLPFSSANSQALTHSEQYVTLKELKMILDKELEHQTSNIIMQTTLCLKDQIIPEIKRQVLQEMDKKKADIELQLQKAQQMIGDKVKYGHLDDKISDLRVSIDRSKINRNQTELKTQTLEQKIQDAESRIDKVEENTLKSIDIYERFQVDTLQAISDFKNSRGQFQRIEKMVDQLSLNFINIEYQTRKNLEEISKRISIVESMEEIPFNLKKDSYQRNLISDLKKNFSNCSDIGNENSSGLEVKEIQQPYTSRYDVQVNLQIHDQYSIKNSFADKIGLTESIGDFDMNPTLTEMMQSKIKDNTYQQRGGIHSNTRENQMNSGAHQMPRSEQYSYSYKSKPKEEKQIDSYTLPTFNQFSQTMNKSNFPKSDHVISRLFPSQQSRISEVGQQTEGDEYSDERGGLELSSEINYIRKGLPQMFNYVESTYALQQDEISEEVQDELEGEKRYPQCTNGFSEIKVGNEVESQQFPEDIVNQMFTTSLCSQSSQLDEDQNILFASLVNQRKENKTNMIPQSSLDNIISNKGQTYFSIQEE